MKNKQNAYLRSSFCLLIFVSLGYLLKFYPNYLTVFDEPVQTLVRGELPAVATQFFKAVTVVGNTPIQILMLVGLVGFYYSKKWYVESAFTGLSGVLAGALIFVFKTLYQRPRPSLEHLVHAGGFSFPSGHSLGTMMIIGSLIIVLGQRVSGTWLRRTLQGLLGLTIFLVGLSRIYLGVHYPTDVVAGFTLGFGTLSALLPIYEQKRFEWRFQNKQK